MFPWRDPTLPLRFDRFMTAALHDPERGYYTRRIRRVGQRGDFSTTATLSPALGRAIANWAAESLTTTRCRDLIELGPGDGTLASAVLRGLPLLRRCRIRLHLVEHSSPLRDLQRERLGGRVRWHPSVTEALDACGGNACLYSNEFVDAFPARRFRLGESGWRECWVLPQQELWRDVDPLPESSIFRRDWPPGQMVEVHESFHGWLDETLPRWRRGRMLTIDYGATIDALYHRCPAGSLRGYFHHQVVRGMECLARPGQQDLTADVNFTDLSEWSDPATELVQLIPQAEFLAGHIRPDDPADRFAADPEGAGGGFMVLETTRRT